MAQANEEYKQKLRQRNISHNATGGETVHSEDQSIQEEAKEANNTPGSPGEASKDTPAENPAEVPVVSMSDFEVVDLNNKLNLLMSAINKVNTNFQPEA